MRQVELSLPPGVEFSHLCYSPLTPLALLICLCIWPVSLRLGGWFLLIWMPGTYTLHQAVGVLSVVYLPLSEIYPCNSLLEGKPPLHTVALHKPEKIHKKYILIKYIYTRIMIFLVSLSILFFLQNNLHGKIWCSKLKKKFFLKFLVFFEK